MNPERSHFDQEAAVYPEAIGDTATQFQKWQLISRHAGAGAAAADLGAASGRHSIPLAENGAYVVAVDLSTEMLRRLQRNAEARGVSHSVGIVAADLQALPLQPEYFDLVYCFSTLLLLPHRQQADVVQRMAALLKPGGILILDVAGRHSMALRYWHRYYRKRGFPGIFGWTLGAARQLVSDCGLSLLEMHPHGLASQFLLLPGMAAIPGLENWVRGTGLRSGFDARLSATLPSLAERWYLVARRPANETP